MAKKVQDELAFGMESVLADESYQKIFAKPKLAALSEPEEVKLSAANASDAFNALIAISEKLDELGFAKSAMQLIKAAHSIEEELMPPGDTFSQSEKERWFDRPSEAPEPYYGNKESSKDNDLDDLLRELGEEGSGGPWDTNKDLPKDLGDVNDVMDKPSDEDKEEGNPEC